MQQIIIQIVGAFFAVYTAAMIFDAPRSTRLNCGVIAVLSWAIYLALKPSSTELAAIYCSALFISLCAQVEARRVKTPVTVILLPSLFLLVPGVPLYRAIFYLLREQTTQSQDQMRLTFMTAGMIALAIFTADFLVRFYYRLRRHRRV
ncbi:MAG: threonine/serine exporter family protein [Eubacteriales bacterium]|nr:threonine/serine exporter family protein [Eubacteriales bacterium]